MDWNGEASVPARLSRELGVPVDDRSVAGAQVSSNAEARREGLDIRAQLGGDRPDILVMTGGGNDLGEACGCDTGCAAEVDTLLTRDGRGELGEFLREVVAGGTDVFVLGYASPPLGGNEFSGCMPHLRTLAERLENLQGVTHVPVHHVIDPADISLYDADRVHPSVRGSAIMAGVLSDAISRVRWR
jgi:lysophospholipase L1-like esterase